MDWTYLFNLIISYLEHVLAPETFWALLISRYIPLVTIITLVITGLCGIVKYYKTKNIEIYERVLKEVYAPLYGYFIKQELFLDIHSIDLDEEDVPILNLTNEIVTIKNGEKLSTIDSFCDLNRTRFIEILKSTNAGLASKQLITLLNMYEMLILMEEKYDIGSEAWKKATIIKVEVEKALRKEILLGIKKKYKKLGIKSTKSNLWEQTGQRIVFNYEIEDKIKALEEDLKENYDKYIKRA